MENSKFQLRARKFICEACDAVTLVDFYQPLAPLYSCPMCISTMDYMNDLVVVEKERGDSSELSDDELVKKYEKYCQGTDRPASFAKWFGVWG